MLLDADLRNVNIHINHSLFIHTYTLGIYIGLPDLETRLSLLKQSLSEVKVNDDIRMEELAQRMEGYSGADITNVCRDAALQPMRECIQVSLK